LTSTISWRGRGREKIQQRNREEELRAQIEILAVETDDIGAAVNKSLAIEFG
jgi:hypothetical protein